MDKGTNGTVNMFLCIIGGPCFRKLAKASEGNDSAGTDPESRPPTWFKFLLEIHNKGAERKFTGKISDYLVFRKHRLRKCHSLCGSDPLLFPAKDIIFGV